MNGAKFCNWLKAKLGLGILKIDSVTGDAKHFSNIILIDSQDNIRWMLLILHFKGKETEVASSEAWISELVSGSHMIWT